MMIRMELGQAGYDILVERGCLQRAGSELDLDRKVLVVTDEGVPAEYAQTVAAQCAQATVVTVPQGERSKSLDMFGKLLSEMLKNGFTRGDCVCAVGGGVVGDLAGFAAACYMRGIDFYNLPTTVLAQVDSSIGGKTAVNLDGVKNTVGAFWQPKKVLIDPDTLKTLAPRQTANGLAEALKAGLIADERLFAAFETGDPAEDPETILPAALLVKKRVVEEDEKETGLRRILNFGHTVGHGIESVTGLLHGECVALGMIPMCSESVRARLLPVLEKLGLPTEVRADPEAVYAVMLHDKKAARGEITVVRVERPGSFVLESVWPETLREAIRQVVRP